MSTFRKIEETFFAYQPKEGLGWFAHAWIALLFVGGLIFWGAFFSWGMFNINFQDWAEISAPRFAIVQDALKHGVLPLHAAADSGLRGVTDRFFVIPDVIYSPQMLLLGVLSVGQFALANTLLFYTIGVLALLWLRRRFELSPAAYALLFLMVNFNGYIQSHLSIGHATWVVSYLFPWLIVLAIQVLDQPRGWSWVAATSFLLFFMLINGGIHQYIWSLMFLGLLGIAAYRRFWIVLKALVFAGLLGAVRLLPPTLELGDFNHQFLTGFPTLRLLASGFISLVTPQQAYSLRTILNYTGFWELDIYLGKAGGLALLILGGLLWLRNSLARRQFPQLWLPVIALGVLSYDALFKPLFELPFPLFNAERVTSRMIVLPFLVAAVLGAANLQALLHRTNKPWPGTLLKVATMVLLALLGYDLYRHAVLWQISAASQAFVATPIDLATKIVSNHPDLAYFQLLWIGGAISLFAGLFLIGMTWRERRKPPLGREVDEKMHPLGNHQSPKGMTRQLDNLW